MSNLQDLLSEGRPRIEELEARAESQPLNIPEQVKNRVTMILTLHHEQQGEQPTTFNPNFSNLLYEDEQAFNRRFKATEEWWQIDLGWFQEDKAGFILIENSEGKNYLVNPTEEERLDTAKKTLLLSFDKKDSLIIPPGGFQQLLPTTHKMYVKSLHGPLRYRITVLPK